MSTTTGSRTKTGCYTCRIRKKKCDEAKPFCLNCRSREIVCHAYDEKPAWMEGMGNWSEVMQSKEAASIREAAETTYKLRRRLQRIPNVQNTGQKINRNPNASQLPFGNMIYLLAGRSQLDVNDGNSNNDESELSVPDIELNSKYINPSYSQLDINVPQATSSTTTSCQPLPLIQSTLNMILSPHIAAPQDVNLFQTYFNIIFPMQYSTLTTTSACSKQWLFEALLHSPAFYNASASIASSFVVLSSTPNSHTPGTLSRNPSLPPHVLALQSKALIGLHTSISYLTTPSTLALMNNASLLQTGMQILAIITQLISFQVMNFTSGGWEVHHCAARRILGLFQSKFLPDYFTPSPTAAMNDAAGEHKDADVGGMDFFVGTFVWLDIVAQATFGPKEGSFEYVDLLKMGRWDLKGVTGCQTWVMIAIAEITALELFKSQSIDILNEVCAEELYTRGKDLENSIRRAIAVLQRDIMSSVWGSDGDDCKAISLVFAHAAIIYLHTVVERPDQGLKQVRESTERCLQCIEGLPVSLLIRVCWPFTVAGCMASEVLHARFRAVVEKMGGIGDISLTKGLAVMEECWKLRSIEEEAGSVGEKKWWWRNVMEKLEVRILLT